MKKTWSKPELVVLQRGNAEAVLAACKLGAASSGPTTINGACYKVQAPCAQCSNQTSS